MNNGQNRPHEVVGTGVDDIFAMAEGTSQTCGTIVETGTAQFYPNTILPKNFTPGGAKHAGILLSTYDGRAVAGLVPRSRIVTHTVTATWTTKNKGLTLVKNEISSPPAP